MLKPTYSIPRLPPKGDLETAAVLREAARAHRHLAELKGRARSIPNQAILIDTLALQEAKASSEVENIVTTQDELFQASLHWDGAGSAAAKEVSSYRDALKRGWDQLHANQGLLTNNVIVEMFQVLKRTDEGFRATPGTALRHQATGELVYVPPQDRREIEAQMTALEAFINDDAASDLDPLVKMALIHHQFESIHPFSDGNGRIGRILNVLYLTRTGLLDIPVLYLSRYVTANKADYYQMLQSVRDNGDWEPWLLYMLRAVSTTSRQTLALIDGMSALMADYKQRLSALSALDDGELQVRLATSLKRDGSVRTSMLKRLSSSMRFSYGARAGALKTAAKRSGSAFCVDVRQRVIVKALVSRHMGKGMARAGALAAHVRYLGREGAGHEGEAGTFFDRHAR